MVDVDKLTYVGKELCRPECIVATANGRIYAADFRGGVSVIEPNGPQHLIRSRDSSFELKPNGILLEESGTFLIAHLGESEGGVYRLYPDGALEPVLLEVEGVPIPPTNFVYKDTKNRLWVTVSTRLEPRALGYRSDNRDGFIVCANADGVRIVADELGYTNECLVHPSGSYLYVNETFTKELSRFPIAENGTLGRKEVVAVFGKGEFPDGLAFDRDGGVWVVCIVSNRVIRVDRTGNREVVIQETDKTWVDRIESAYQTGRMEAHHLKETPSTYLKNVSSIAFGGSDLRTAYLGCLLGDSIPVFRSSFVGAQPIHWHYSGPTYTKQET